MLRSNMKVKELGETKHPFPIRDPYNMLNEQHVRQNDETFQSVQNRKKFKDSQDLMGGPVRRDMGEMTPSQKAFAAKKKLEEVAMRSNGRYAFPGEL